MRLILSWLLLFFAVFLVGCEKGPIEVKYRGQAMGTTWSVKINSEFGYSSKLAEEIQAELDAIDSLMSNWKETSDITRFNNAELNSCTEVSAQTLAVVLVSQRIATLSRGAFDISISPLIELWGFGTEFKSNDPPAGEDIEEYLSRTGLINFYLTDNELCKRNVPLELNLSGVAKGYAVDRVASLLDNQRFQNYLVEVGGELRARGENGRETPWLVAVEQPSDELGLVNYQVAIPLLDQAVATSGDYRNFYKVDDVRYSHIINPSTGYPVSHNAASVTVLAKSSMEADAWATALLVLGPEEGIEIAAKQNLKVMMILRGESGFNVIKSDDWPQI